MSGSPLQEPVTRSQILFYQSEDGTSRIEVRMNRAGSKSRRSSQRTITVFR